MNFVLYCRINLEGLPHSTQATVLQYLRDVTETVIGRSIYSFIYSDCSYFFTVIEIVFVIP